MKRTELSPPVNVEAAEPRATERPVRWGFLVAIGVLLAAALGLALVNLGGIVFSVFMAAFVTVGLNPLVEWLQGRGMSRAWAIVTVILLIVAVLVTVVWVVLPVLVSQIQLIVTSIPGEVAQLRAEGWFDGTNEASNGIIGHLIGWVATSMQDPEFWTTVGGGVAQFGLDVVSALSSGMFIAILTIYFVGTYGATKDAAYRMVSKSRRDTFIEYSEQVLQNVGRYLSGMVMLAFFNAAFSLVILLIAGVPGAFLVALLAFFITLIPLVGTVLTTAAMTVLAFIHSPVSGLVVLIAMLIYMQLEAYVLTPRIMSKAVKVPGSVVLISALAGGTLFGLPGALVAIPISAGIILVIKGVVMPSKELA